MAAAHELFRAAQHPHRILPCTTGSLRQELMQTEVGTESRPNCCTCPSSHGSSAQSTHVTCTLELAVVAIQPEMLRPFCGTPFGWATAGCVPPAPSKHSAHRMVCFIIHGPPPGSQGDAAHSCHGAPDCCNPAHIGWATPSENRGAHRVQAAAARAAANTARTEPARSVCLLSGRSIRGPLHLPWSPS